MTRLLSVLAAVILATGTAMAADVGVLWVGKSGMAERVSTGLKDRMKEIAPDISLEFKPALPSDEVAGKLLDVWQTKKQAVVCMRSPGAKLLKAHGTTVPGFFGASSNPQALGVVDNMDAPEANITGVTYHINAAERIAVFLKLFPETKSIGLIVDSEHPSAAIDVPESTAACEALGISIEVAECTSEVDMLKAAKDFGSRMDLVVLGSQAKVATQAQKLATLIGNKPIGAYNASAIKGTGALIGLAADDVKLGAMLADSIVAVIKDGTPVAQVPVKTDPDPKIILNMTMVNQLGITVPDDIMAKAEQVE